MEAVRKAMASGAGFPGAASRQPIRPAVFANGFALSPYAETGAPGASRKPVSSGNIPHTLWHSSPGSSAQLEVS